MFCCKQRFSWYANCSNLVCLDISFVDALIRPTQKVQLTCAMRSWLGYLHFVWSWQMLGIDRCTKVTCVVWFTLVENMRWKQQNPLKMFMFQAGICSIFQFFQVLMEYFVFLGPIHLPIPSTNSHGCRCNLKLWGMMDRDVWSICLNSGYEGSIMIESNCWWKTSCSSWCGKYRIIYMVSHIPGG